MLKNKHMEFVENKLNLKMADNNASLQWLRNRDLPQPLNNVNLMALLNAPQYIQNHVAIMEEIFDNDTCQPAEFDKDIFLEAVRKLPSL